MHSRGAAGSPWHSSAERCSTSSFPFPSHFCTSPCACAGVCPFGPLPLGRAAAGGCGDGGMECASPSHSCPGSRVRSTSIERWGSGSRVLRDEEEEDGSGEDSEGSPIQSAVVGLPFTTTRFSGRGCICDDASLSLVTGAPFGGLDGLSVAVPFGRVDEDEEAFPQVQGECARRAGLGNVLYVEPRDVYLRA